MEGWMKAPNRNKLEKEIKKEKERELSSLQLVSRGEKLGWRQKP